MRWRRVLQYFVPTRRQTGALLIAYLGFILLVMFGGCADRIILYPSTEPILNPRLTRIEVPAYEGGGKVVEVWIQRSPGAASQEPRAYCLEFLGNASRAEWMAEDTALRWGRRPIEAWAVNYPGYGGSAGPARLKSIPPSALAAYDALAARAGGKPIFLIGQSLGSAAALYVAANRPCAGMVLTNPPPLRSLILGNFGWWNLWLVAGPVAMAVPSELDSLTNAGKVNVPAVFLLAGRDHVVPPKYQAKVFDAYAGEKRAIHRAEADHNDPLDGVASEEFEAAMDWLLDHAGITSAATTQATH